MHLIFDFDGTLIDSFDCVMKKTILLADEFHYRKITEDEIIHLRDLSSREIIRYLQVPLHNIPSLIYSMRSHLRDEMVRLKPIAGIPEMLEKLHQAGLTFGILTSNSSENVTAWLTLNQLQHYFTFIQTEPTFFSKKYLLRKILRLYKINPAETFYVCDETRDIDAAACNDIKSIAVTWGYNSEKALLEYQPTFIAKMPDDILRICGL